MSSPEQKGSFRSVIYVPVGGEGPPVDIHYESLEERSINICCPDTGDKCLIEKGPAPSDFAAGSWTYRCPSCGEKHTQSYRATQPLDPNTRSRTIDIAFKVDLGELIEGQHIVTQGIELRTTSGSVLHYDFVPGFVRRDPRDQDLDTSWGLGQVCDDLGSEYDHQGCGGWGAHPDGIVHWGDEDLGRGIPKAASWVEIEFIPAHYWTVPGPWIFKMRVDLSSGSVLQVTAGI